MCGIAGYLGWGSARDGASAVLGRMAGRLAHRGPDDSGIWCDESAMVGLAHRRLSIIDLSPAGHQPMMSACGRYVVTYNGEIYNHRELSGDLQGERVRFRGHSDTEVLLEAVVRWGLDATLRRLNGMFAFGLWDRQERTLHLVRDRMGEKPLYYGVFGGCLVFGSELRALRAHPSCDAAIDSAALANFLRLSYVPAPYSIYAGIGKLPPAHRLSWRAGQDQPVPQPYWSIEDAAAAPVDMQGDEAAWLQGAETLLADAVRMRMVADVPLGAFLSGGIDSSLVVALMQKQSATPVRTFTIGFEDRAFDESEHAAAVARHLGTCHTGHVLRSREVMQSVTELAAVYDEPFADASQLPTLLLARMTRQQVTVALSGDGGDELFGGYHRYVSAEGLWRRAHALPAPARTLLGRLLTLPAPATWDRLLKAARGLPANAGEKVYKLARALTSDTPVAYYAAVASRFPRPAGLLTGAGEHAWLPDVHRPGLACRTASDQLMYLDQRLYLPDDVLVKVDRATMAVGLEARVPMLDHRLVEYAWRLPVSVKIRGGRGKWLLRTLLKRHLPESLFERPKAGFAVPVAEWLRGPLRDWAQALLDRAALAGDGLLRPEAVERLWLEHLQRRADHRDILWNILMYRAWRIAQ